MRSVIKEYQEGSVESSVGHEDGGSLGDWWEVKLNLRGGNTSVSWDVCRKNITTL